MATSGNALLGGIGGFMEGWRFGRELVEGDAADRQSRAVAQAAQQKAQTAAEKQAFERSKFETTQNVAIDKANQLDRRRGLQLEAQKNHWGVLEDQGRQSADLAKRKFTQDQYEFNADRPYRNAQTADIQGRVDNRNREQAFQTEALSTGEAMRKALGGGELNDDEFTRVNRILPWYSQDAVNSQKRLRSVFVQAAQKYQAGDDAGAVALFGTDEGKQALVAAFGPMIAQTVGSVSKDGYYRTQSVEPVGLFRDPTGKNLGVNLRVTRELTEDAKSRLGRVANDPSLSKEEREQARGILTADHTVLAPLTDGRVPVGEGGSPRFFTPQEMHSATANIAKLAQWQREKPEEFQATQDYVDAIQSAKNPQEANRLYIARRDARTKAQLAQDEKSLNRATADKRALESAWSGVVRNLQPGATAYRDYPEILTREQDRVGRIAAEGAQMIQDAKGPVSISDIYDRLTQKYPPNQIPTEQDPGAPAQAPSYARPEVQRVIQQMTPEQRAIGDLLQSGQINREEAKRRWQALGVGR